MTDLTERFRILVVMDDLQIFIAQNANEGKDFPIVGALWLHLKKFNAKH